MDDQHLNTAVDIIAGHPNVSLARSRDETEPSFTDRQTILRALITRDPSVFLGIILK